MALADDLRGQFEAGLSYPDTYPGVFHAYDALHPRAGRGPGRRRGAGAAPALNPAHPEPLTPG